VYSWLCGKYRDVGGTPIPCSSRDDDRPPAEEAATIGGQSSEGNFTRGVDFACGIIYAVSIVIIAGLFDATCNDRFLISFMSVFHLTDVLGLDSDAL
jgi:hypothetical protein